MVPSRGGGPPRHRKETPSRSKAWPSPPPSLALPQRLRGLGALAEGSGSLPRVYTEEGECERAETLSSLAVSEQTLPPGPLGWLVSEA